MFIWKGRKDKREQERNDYRVKKTSANHCLYKIITERKMESYDKGRVLSSFTPDTKTEKHYADYRFYKTKQRNQIHEWSENTKRQPGNSSPIPSPFTAHAKYLGSLIKGPVPLYISFTDLTSFERNLET